MSEAPRGEKSQEEIKEMQFERLTNIIRALHEMGQNIASHTGQIEEKLKGLKAQGKDFNRVWEDYVWGWSDQGETGTTPGLENLKHLEKELEGLSEKLDTEK